MGSILYERGFIDSMYKMNEVREYGHRQVSWRTVVIQEGNEENPGYGDSCGTEK